MPIRVQSRKPSKPAQSQPAPPNGALPFNLPKPSPGKEQLPPGISLCMIVKNEEKFLEQCLRSVKGVVDEMCIVDTGSSDRTVEIAERFGARVERRAWRDDFAWARNEAIAMATKRWIFFLDADEELSEDSRASLMALKNVPADKTGAYIRCENLSDDYKGTGVMSHLLVRIFPNHPKIRFINPIHEYVAFDGDELGIDTRLSDIRIIHHGYLSDVVADRNKASRNMALIRKVCEENPNDPFHWYNLGMTAHVLKDWDEAIFALEKMRAILDGKPRGFAPQAYVTLAESYMEARNDNERALEIIQGVLKDAPTLANAHFSLGRILYRRGRLDEAREAFLATIEDGKHMSVHFIVDDQVYTWKAQLTLGVLAADQKNFEEAVQWYDKGLKNAPDVQPLILNRAHALEALGRYGDAEAAFHSAFEKFDDEPSIVQYVNYLLRRKDFHRAFALMEQTQSKVSPRCAATFFIAAAQVAQRQGDSLSEQRYLERARECAPTSGPVLDALDKFYVSRNDVLAVERLREEEMQYEPLEIPDFVRRSYRLIAMERFEDALDVAKKGLVSAPLEAELRYNAAVAELRLGRRSEALTHLRAILPDSEPIGAKAAMLHAMLLREDGQASRALELVEAALRKQPEQVDLILLHAQLLEQLGRVEKAAQDLERAFTLDAPRIGVELASLYMRAGKFVEAKDVASRALAARA